MSTSEPARVDFESSGGLRIAAYRWDPAGEPGDERSVTWGIRALTPGDAPD